MQRLVLALAQWRKLVPEHNQGLARQPLLHELEELLLPQSKPHDVTIRARSQHKPAALSALAAEQLL